MKFTAKRVLAAGAVFTAALVTPVSLSIALPSVDNSPASPATPASPDTVIYHETKGNTGNYVEFLPGDGSKATTQSISAGGGCSTPRVNGTPILNFSASFYTDSGYAGTPSSAIVGAFNGRTGVCSITPDWAINNGGASGAEALDFSVGSNSVVSGRIFSDATLALQGESGPSGSPISIELVESAGGNQVATQTCTIPGPGTNITADTQAPSGGACNPNTGNSGAIFDTVEIRVLTVNASASVVGPSSNFTLASQICGGQSIQSTGNGGVSATLSLPAGAGCKFFTTFSSSVQGNGEPILDFAGYSPSPVPFTVKVTWPLQPECQPYPDAFDPSTNPSGIPPALALPVCPPHQFSIDGVTYFDQTYCQTATPPASPSQPQSGLCTTNKSYDNNDPNTGAPLVLPNTNPPAPATQITETWVGDIDWWFR
jgi:hypothetical protein